MSFPIINAKTKNYEMSDEVYDHLVKRFATLERVLPKSEVVCDVELEKNISHHSGNIYRAEVNIAFAGKVVRAEADGETMEMAIDLAKGEMKRELEKFNSRSESLFRRGARRAKNLFKFGE